MDTGGSINNENNFLLAGCHRRELALCAWLFVLSFLALNDYLHCNEAIAFVSICDLSHRQRFGFVAFVMQQFHPTPVAY